MNLLIVEDNVTLSEMLKAQVTKMGFQATCVSDGEQAFNLLKDNSEYQLALIDWVMPKMDGLELCRHIRAEKSRAPIYLILLTANDLPENVIAGLDAGADDYIVKPYNPAELRARIRVGERMINMMHALQEQNKLQGALEMARTVCHEMNQPLQVAASYCELLKLDVEKSTDNYQAIERIDENIFRIGELTRKIMRLSSCSYKSFLGGREVLLDLDSENDNVPPDNANR